MRPMTTNGGPHPADKWADTTTDEILAMISVADDSVTPEAAAARQAKRDMRPLLFAIFNTHHALVQADERTMLATNASKHAATPLDPAPRMTDTINAVNALFATTPYAAHFASPDAQAMIRQIIGQRTVDVMHIERRWHTEDTPAAAAYRASLTKGA